MNSERKWGLPEKLRVMLALDSPKSLAAVHLYVPPSSGLGSCENRKQQCPHQWWKTNRQQENSAANSSYSWSKTYQSTFLFCLFTCFTLLLAWYFQPVWNISDSVKQSWLLLTFPLFHLPHLPNCTPPPNSSTQIHTPLSFCKNNRPSSIVCLFWLFVFSLLFPWSYSHTHKFVFFYMVTLYLSEHVAP